MPHESVMGFLASFWKGWPAGVSYVNIHEILGEGPWGMQVCLLAGEALQGGLGAYPCSATN